MKPETTETIYVAGWRYFVNADGEVEETQAQAQQQASRWHLRALRTPLHLSHARIVEGGTLQDTTEGP